MLSCDLHDHIEIACMYHFSVELILKSGECIAGVANTILLQSKTAENIKTVIETDVEVAIEAEAEIKAVSSTVAYKKEECLQLIAEDNTTILVPLTSLLSMRALKVNSHFDIVHFE